MCRLRVTVLCPSLGGQGLRFPTLAALAQGIQPEESNLLNAIRLCIKVLA